MHTLPSTDLNRMIHAIKHECNIRIREIKLEASQEYNLIKSEIILANEKRLAVEYAKKLKTIEKECSNEESNISQRFKLKLEQVKENIFNNLIDNIKLKVKNESTSLHLIRQIADKFDHKFCYIFCFKKDINNVQKVFDSKDIEYEIKELPAEALGGLILCSKDGKEIWDNTFETRINVLLEKSLDKINKEIFY